MEKTYRFVKASEGKFPSAEGHYHFRKPDDKTFGGWWKWAQYVVSHAIDKEVYINEKWEWLEEIPKDEKQKEGIPFLLFGENYVQGESGEQDEVVRFAEMCIVFGLKFDGLRQEWKDGTGRVVTRKIIYDFIKPKL